jgi:hypothetical protein
VDLGGLRRVQDLALQNLPAAVRAVVASLAATT